MYERELIIGAFLIGMVVFLSATVVAVVTFERRRKSALCSNCHQRVPKDSISMDGMQCAKCEDQAARPIFTRESICRHCGAALTAGDLVRLWDGHDYCSRCVEAAHPDLARFAHEHDRLEETMPHSSWHVARNILLFTHLITMATLGTFVLFAGIYHDRILDGLLGVGLLFLLNCVIAIPLAIGSAYAHSVSRGHVAVQDGRLRFWGGEIDFFECPLIDCQWSLGSLRRTTFVFGGRVVILSVPRPAPARELTIAVGFSFESRTIWEAFLTLALIKRRNP